MARELDYGEAAQEINASESLRLQFTFSDNAEEEVNIHYPPRIKRLALAVGALGIFACAYGLATMLSIHGDSFRKQADNDSLESKAAYVPPNMQPGLRPPHGTLWRGSTHWFPNSSAGVGNAFYQPTQFLSEYGVPLHIYRSFHFSGWWDFSAGELEFMKLGGIIFYTIQPHSWKEEAANTAGLQRYAQAIKKVAPVKVIVAPGYEPEGHAAPLATGHELWGTVGEYLKYRKKIKKVFEKEGVTNVIWAMDFGDKCSFDSRYCAQIPKLTPKDGSIGWLFFNFFQTMGEDKWNKLHVAKPSPHWLSPPHIDAFVNLFKQQGWMHIPWGVGAWGTNYETNAPPPYTSVIPVADRKKFIKDVLPTVEKHPQIKALVYFNSLYSLIANCPNISIQGKGDNAHNFAMMTYNQSTELMGVFNTYLHNSRFKANDHNYPGKHVKPPAGHGFCGGQIGSTDPNVDQR